MTSRYLLLPAVFLAACIGLREMGFIMKYISVLILFTLLSSCSLQSKNVCAYKGDEYVLHVNDSTDIMRYKNRIEIVEHKLKLNDFKSYGNPGLYIYLVTPYAENNVNFFFIPSQKEKESFFLSNMNGINACGKIAFNEEQQSDLLKSGVEFFPYVEIYKDGKFPYNGGLDSYPLILGYRKMENGEKYYFSFVVFSQHPVGKNKLLLNTFPSYPAIISEYENFAQLLGSLTSSDVSRDYCRIAAALNL